MSKKITKKLFNPALYKASDTISNILAAKPKVGKTHGILLPHGRGAGVSTFCAFKILQFLAKPSNNKKNVLVMRRFEEDIPYSLFEMFQWCIRHINAQEEFVAIKHKRSIVCKKNGNSIYFRGYDSLINPQQAGEVSIVGNVPILFVDDAEQFEQSELNALIDANLGGDQVVGGNAVLLLSYSPQSSSHWLNKIVEDYNRKILDKTCQVFHSDYTTVPREWLGEAFFENARRLKETNQKAYENEYLGLPN